ncbi:hypothetical protein D3C80_1803770 [compost metagenome]
MLNETGRILRLFHFFANLFHAVDQRFVAQQTHTRLQFIEHADGFFRLLKLLTLLLILAFMGIQRTFKFATTAAQGTDIRFRIGVKRDG